MNSPNSNNTAQTLLEDGLRHFQIEATEEQCRQWMGYLEILNKWNQKINLTAVRSIPKMVSRHILESLALHPYLHGERLIDVGSGAGVPGIPLAILFPNKAFYLLDSNQKKQIFVAQAAKTLSLKNVYCVHSLVEQYQPQQKFSTILTRAFKPLGTMLGLTQHLADETGQFLAMLGRISSETTTVPEGFVLKEIVSLAIPQESAQRHLAIIEKSIPTADDFSGRRRVFEP